VSGTIGADIARTAPALFTLSGSGSGQVLAINQDRSINDAAHPAPAGTFITLYATGEGETNPPGQNGLPARVPLPLPVLPVTVSIGGRSATVQYAGGAPGIVAGVMQVNVQIPTGLTAGAVPIVLTAGGVASQNNITIYVN